MVTQATGQIAEDHISLFKAGAKIGAVKGALCGAAAAVVVGILAASGGIALPVAIGACAVAVVAGILSGSVSEAVTGWIAEHIFQFGKKAHTMGGAGRALGAFQGLLAGGAAAAVIITTALATGGLSLPIMLAAGAAVGISTLVSTVTEGFAGFVAGLIFKDKHHKQGPVVQMDQGQQGDGLGPGKRDPGIAERMETVRQQNVGRDGLGRGKNDPDIAARMQAFREQNGQYPVQDANQVAPPQGPVAGGVGARSR